MAHPVRLQQAKSGRNHDVSVQDHHRLDGPGPNAARSAGGSQGWLPDLEPHEVPGKARESSSGLSAGREAGDAGSQWSRASRHRIDWLGQRFPSIRIVNLLYEKTVETDVYLALRLRIGLFSKFVGKLQAILASLPRQLSETMLVTPREQRERVRDTLVTNIGAQVNAVEQQGFDLDAITEADLGEPVRPAPYVDLDVLDMLILRPELLPPGVSVDSMGPREYKYSAPGMREPLRVTTDAEYFDQHATSVELWSPGSPLFPAPEEILSLAETLQGEMRPLSELLNRSGS